MCLQMIVLVSFFPVKQPNKVPNFLNTMQLEHFFLDMNHSFQNPDHFYEKKNFFLATKKMYNGFWERILRIQICRTGGNFEWKSILNQFTRCRNVQGVFLAYQYRVSLTCQSRDCLDYQYRVSLTCQSRECLAYQYRVSLTCQSRDCL